MINVIWFLMLGAGIVAAILTGETPAVTEAVITGSEKAVETALGLVGILALWSGVMKIAEDSGLTRILARLIRPLAVRLFPDLASSPEAIGAIVMAMSANLLGLGNAATPLGLKAMKKMQEVNPHPETASNAMITFLAITTSSITLIPTTVIALRTAAGSESPTLIVGPTIAATTVSTLTAILVDRLLRPGSR